MVPAEKGVVDTSIASAEGRKVITINILGSTEPFLYPFYLFIISYIYTLDKTNTSPKDLTGEEVAKLFKEMMKNMTFTTEEANLNSNKSTSINEVSNFINPLVIASSLGDVLKELDFVVNCDIEGNVERDHFEPKIKISFKVARSMESVLKLKQQELEQIQIMNRIETEREDDKIERDYKLLELLKKQKESSTS